MPKRNKPQSGAYPAVVPDGQNTRLGTAQQALDACETLVEDNIRGERGIRWKQWLGLFHGNAPFSVTDQTNRNRKWQTNINTRIAHALLEGACVPYYNLFEGGPSMSVVRLKGKNQEDTDRRSRLATRHFNHAIKQLGISDTFFTCARSFVGFGRGFWWNPSPSSWKPESKQFYEALFPRQAPTDTDRIEFFAVRVKMSPSELYRHVRDEEQARASGWNRAEVMRALERASDVDPSSVTAANDYVQYQKDLHSHDLTTQSTTGFVDLIYVYGKEFDGTWTMGVVDRHDIRQNPRNKQPEREWLFYRKGYAERIEELIVPYIYDPGDGTMNGVEGLASEIYGLAMLFDRMFCKITDGGFIRSLMALTSRSTTGQIDGTLAVRGGVIHLPQGAEAVNSQAFSDLQGPMAVSRMILELIGRVSGVHLPESDRPVGNPDTAMEARMKFSQRTMLTASGVSRYYIAQDTAYDTMFSRLLNHLDVGASLGHQSNVADEFIENCKDDDLKLDDLKDYKLVRSYRVSGGGSNMEQQQALGSLVGLSGAMPATGRTKYFQDFIASTAGPDKVDEFFPTDFDELGEPQWEATVENNLANNGSVPMLTGGQNHDGHLQVHLQGLAEGIASVQQGADPSIVMSFGTIMLPHSERTLQMFAQDQTAKAKVKAYGDQLKVLSQQYGQLGQLIQQQRQQQADAQRAQAIQQGMDPKLQLQAAEKQARTQLKAGQTSANLQMSAQKHAQALRQKEETHQQQLRQNAQKDQE